MEIFPTKQLKFKLIGNKEETLNKLNRRTEKSEGLTSSYTNKSFRGIVNGNKFKIISSSIGTGAFCVISGSIGSDTGNVKVEIHQAFRILLSILLCFPAIAILIALLTGSPKPNLLLAMVVIGQILMIRYVFIGLFFMVLSRQSLNKLRNVLDIEWLI